MINWFFGGDFRIFKFSKVFISVSRCVFVCVCVRLCVVCLKSLNRWLIRLIVIGLSVVFEY